MKNKDRGYIGSGLIFSLISYGNHKRGFLLAKTKKIPIVPYDFTFYEIYLLYKYVQMTIQELLLNSILVETEDDDATVVADEPAVEGDDDDDDTTEDDDAAVVEEGDDEKD
ncbi:MAG: hypothetical protein WC875_03780, partial [Candidatus Absconditabacterales bacterium]